jgi:hypothetical protein
VSRSSCCQHVGVAQRAERDPPVDPAAQHQLAREHLPAAIATVEQQREPGYHPIYAQADPELLVLINDEAAKGRLRSWAAFTHTASAICRGVGAARIDAAIVRNAIAQLGNTR